MWVTILNIVLFSPVLDATPKVDKSFQVGVYYSELTHDEKQLLWDSEHFAVNNRNFDGSANNTDGCFHYSSTCQPDYVHHVFLVKLNSQMHRIVFSYNYRILSMD